MKIGVQGFNPWTPAEVYPKGLLIPPKQKPVRHRTCSGSNKFPTSGIKPLLVAACFNVCATITYSLFHIFHVVIKKMTFKTPSPTVYFGSLLITIPVAGLVYWILQTQNLIGNGLLVLGAGLLIGHLIGTCSRAAASAPRRAPTADHTSHTTAVQPGDTTSLYVGNLAYRAKRGELHALFSQYGQVNSVRIMMDRTTHRPRGYAFVEMESNAAHEAISQLDNTEFCERNLRVSEAKQRQ